MLTPFDHLQMRQETAYATTPYRETLVVIPNITSGSNYEPFSDSPYEITGAASGQGSVTYETYRLMARVKIVKDTTLFGMNQVVPGVEIGDYLLYFKDGDKPVLDRVVDNRNAYIWLDAINFRPYNVTVNGLAQTFDVFVHAKKYSPKYRMTGT
jgi:hypothetical protein